MTSELDKSYIKVLNDLKFKINAARQKASLSVNKELLLMYWEVGSTISKIQREEGWGSKIIDRLSKDLRIEFPDMKGFSIRNLKYMKTFAEAYPDFLIVQQPAPQMQYKPHLDSRTIKVQQIAAQIPWSYHQVLFDRLRTVEERLFYMIKTIQNGWKRDILVLQIESNLYLRQGKAITNFNVTLPPPQSDLATETIKNPYLFDFLSLSEEAQEREVERALIQHIKKFILELGRGFAYVGNQFNLNVEGDEFFLDLLFYNYHLKCFVIFELKVGDFKPEFAGKLNFYINTVNEQIAKNDHNPTIGVLLCRTPNETVIKYSLAGIKTPMGVAEYKLSKFLPLNLKGEIPTIKELEAEIDKGFESLALSKSPLEEKLDRIKVKIESLRQEPIQESKSKETLDRVIRKDIIPFLTLLTDELKTIGRYFVESHFEYVIDTKWVSSKDILKFLSDYDKQINEIRFEIRFSGFREAGKQAFDCWLTIYIHFERFWYNFQVEMGKSIMKKLYHHALDKDEIRFLIETFTGLITTQIESLLDSLIK